MRLTRIVPMLATTDMDTTVAFYRDALGFALGDRFESGGTTWWCEMQRDGQRLMFSSHAVEDTPATRAGYVQTSVNFYVDDVEALYESLSAAGHAVSELRVTFYKMKEFDLKDPSGYTLLIGQPSNEPPTVQDPSDAPF